MRVIALLCQNTLVKGHIRILCGMGLIYLFGIADSLDQPSRDDPGLRFQDVFFQVSAMIMKIRRILMAYLPVQHARIDPRCYAFPFDDSADVTLLLSSVLYPSTPLSSPHSQLSLDTILHPVLSASRRRLAALRALPNSSWPIIHL